MRHKVRVVIIIKQWKKPLNKQKNLEKINQKHKYRFNWKVVFKAANTRLDWYRIYALIAINNILNP